MHKVSVFGLGYVGLPSAAVFADSGLQVVGVDVNQSAVDIINSGRAHIVEPGLDDLLNKVVGNGTLRATTIAEAADVFIIAVPTPFKEGNAPDLKFIESAANMIAPLLQKGNLVILESTSPVGATEQLAAWLKALRPDLTIPDLDGADGDIYLAYCPERILPGKVIQEVVENDRVIGGITPKSSELAVEFYKHAVKGECHVTNARTAELCKLSENSFRDVNIAFANELSVISAKLGVDVYELIALTNRHPRVNILQPGTGVGGHCIAVDPWFIVDSAPEEARIIRTAREVNDAKPHWVVAQVAKLAAEIEKPVIACLGLAYKPDVDDLRESPSVDAVKIMVAQGLGEIIVCEPFVDALPGSLAELGVQLADIDSALDKANIVVFLTAHGQFKQIPKALLADKSVFDACGLTR
jgi:UDP-N-acetyl-D-mannosaminuronic acid dehydrogenase